MRSFGGENDSPSRNISRYLDTLAERLPQIGLDVRQIWRNDRFGRGGDHTEFLNAGFPAVRSPSRSRITTGSTRIAHRKGHQYGDTVDEMDFPYLAKVDRAEHRRARRHRQRPAAARAEVEGAVSTDTTVNWECLRGVRIRRSVAADR